MPIQLIIFLAAIVLAVIVGGAALIANAQRRAVLARAGSSDDGEAATIVLRPVRDQRESRGLRQWLVETFPGPTAEDAASQEKLVQAGFDTPTAPATYFFARVVSFVHTSDSSASVPLLSYPKMS